MSEDVKPTREKLVSHGATLVAESWGEPSRAGIILLHGGGQTRHAWRNSGAQLARLGYRVTIPDLRGHGESDWSPDGRYSAELFADDVRAWCAREPAPPVVVGASLGGLSSLFALGEAPQTAVRALVLVDIAHRGEPVGVSRILNFMRAYPDGFESFEQATAAVAQYLPHRAVASAGEGLRKNLRERDGRLKWHWDPRLLQGSDSGEQREQNAQRLLRAARAIDAPILLVRGAESDLLSPEIADQFCAEVPRARRVDVHGARHMVAGDQNDPFLDVIVEFLAQPELATCALASAQ